MNIFVRNILYECFQAKHKMGLDRSLRILRLWSRVPVNPAVNLNILFPVRTSSSLLF